jgi:hypothetical protein
VRGFDRREHLDAVVQVARHEVSAAQEERAVVGRLEHE